MARPRQFDEDRALDAAMRVFWSHGYEATSTEELCTATNLKRSSIYNTFHSKHQLFLRALSRYLDQRTDLLLEMLDSSQPLRQRLYAALDHAVTEESSGKRNGCFAVNTTVELSPHDPATDRLLRRDRDRRIAAIAAAVDAARAAGDNAGQRSPQALAQFVNATLAGIRVAARSGAGVAELRAIADTAMDAI